MSTLRHVLSASCTAAALLISGSAFAQDAAPQDTTEVEDLVVFGRAEQRIGKASAASEGALAGADLTVRPFLRPAELLELVPGMMVTQHSGSGKANQYFLRGYNLDHGADFGLTIDGVPMNFRTHGHGQGYLDINGLVPEVVARVDYRKGPYRADYGDFNLVGGAQISTRNTFDKNYVSAEAGDFNHRRLAAGASWEGAEGTFLIAGQAKTYDGPWQLPEDLKHFSAYAKAARDTSLGNVSLSLSVYDATWKPTEQIADRAIGTLVPDAYGALDFDLRGDTEREILVAKLDGDVWRGNLYFQHYDWDMVSNFTYFLTGPDGDEIDQSMKMNGYGGRLERDFKLSDTLSITTGGDFRYDDIDRVGLHTTIGGVRTPVNGATEAALSEFAVEEASASLYAEAHWKPTDRLSFLAGLRADKFNFKTTALDGGAWSGDVDDDIVSPKIGVSYIVADGIAVYANWGQGFHSNDARGVTAPTSPAPGLVKGEAQELGLRYERHGLVATATYWMSEVDSELIYVGDAGSVEPSEASERHGTEFTFFWRPTDRIAIDGVWTDSTARFINGDHVPGALENAGELGFAYIAPNWNTGIRVRYLGEHALIEDNSERSEPSTIVNARVAWTPGRYEVFGELLNIFDSDSKDIEYLYESYLPTIDLGGPVEGLHARAVEPRMVRAGLKVSF